MSAIMKISPQRQIRIPKKMMEALGIEQGDYVEIDVEEDHLVLKPRKLIDPTQGWYWTKEWQAQEREADEEIANGQFSPAFTSAKDALKWLKE